MEINILPTDRIFSNSPDVGPNCTCSRCGKPILKGVPIRCWPDMNTKHEYRFHPQCLGLTVIEDDDIELFDDPEFFN